MTFNKEFVTATKNVPMDTENIVSLLALVALLTFFYIVFGRFVQPGAEKCESSRMSYTNAAAA